MKWRFIPFEGDHEVIADGPTLAEAMEAIEEPCFTVIENEQADCMGNTDATRFSAVANPSWAFPGGYREAAPTARLAIAQIVKKFDAIKRNGGPVYSYMVIDLNRVRDGELGMMSRIFGPTEKRLAELEFDRIKAESADSIEPYLHQFQR